jgi:hypothetical protein
MHAHDTETVDGVRKFLAFTKDSYLTRCSDSVAALVVVVNTRRQGNRLLVLYL